MDRRAASVHPRRSSTTLRHPEQFPITFATNAATAPSLVSKGAATTRSTKCSITLHNDGPRLLTSGRIGANVTWRKPLTRAGSLGAGIGWIEASIARSEEDGPRILADHSRLILCEIYLRMVSAPGRPSLRFLVRNLGTLVRAAMSVESRVTTLVEQVRQNPRLDPNGMTIGRCEMILGLLYQGRKKRALASPHLIEGKRIVAQFGPTPMLARIEAALAELVCS